MYELQSMYKNTDSTVIRYLDKGCRNPAFKEWRGAQSKQLVAPFLYQALMLTPGKPTTTCRDGSQTIRKHYLMPPSK